jgi:hypothetical protein
MKMVNTFILWNMNLQKIKKFFQITVIAIPCIIIQWKLSPLQLSYRLDSFENTVVVNIVLIGGYALCVLIFLNCIIVEKTKKEASYYRYYIFALINGGVLFASFFVLFIVFAGSMCGEFEEVRFVSKSYSTVKIIRTYIDCGAFDSEYPRYRFCKVIYLTPFIRYIQDIDTTTIDKNEWTRVQAKEIKYNVTQ